MWTRIAKIIGTSVHLPRVGVTGDGVASGVYEIRDIAVLVGMESVPGLEDRKRIDCAIVEGYRRMPLSADEEAVENAVAMASLRESILEEPW